MWNWNINRFRWLSHMTFWVKKLYSKINLFSVLKPLHIIKQKNLKSFFYDLFTHILASKEYITAKTYSFIHILFIMVSKFKCCGDVTSLKSYNIEIKTIPVRVERQWAYCIASEPEWNLSYRVWGSADPGTGALPSQSPPSRPLIKAWNSWAMSGSYQ